MDNINNTTELFICFTSRLSSPSSSSMKLSSKSILSPNRADKQISLSASLSRRLRTNGSIKGGGQSPMFLSTNKKRGSGFDTNTEPTSPKVTCIGQVRVKSKKKQQQKYHHQGMKMRSISKRKTGEVSFRRSESKKDQILIAQDGLNHRNQKWVHLPLTICEALKGFGSDFNCFSSCFDKEKNNQSECSLKSSYSCGDVFGRWFVTLEGKGREIELVVGDEIEHENNEEEVIQRKSFRRRRNVMEDIDIAEIEKCNNEERFGVLNESNQNDEKRASICVPPKNALLLMRCRSDPLKMAALANRFWESPLVDDDDEHQDDEIHEKAKEVVEEKKHEVNKDLVEDEIERECGHGHDLGVDEYLALTENVDCLSVIDENVIEEEPLESVVHEINHAPHEETEEVIVVDHLVTVDYCSSESFTNLENIESIRQDNYNYNEDTDDQEEHEMRRLSQDSYVSVSMLFYSEDLSEEQETELKSNALERNSSETESDRADEQVTELETESDSNQHCRNIETKTETEASLSAQTPTETRLPDCLLLMMCEPKLSMEVSKETWVCSTDFIKCLPPQQKTEKKKVTKINGGDQFKKRVSIDKNPGYSTQNLKLQPARSSCSFPLPAPAPVITMSMMVEQKLGKSAVAGYEPFVLTRCKSEPMRKSAKFAAPEGCFWKDRKLEPHRGAAGVGC